MTTAVCVIVGVLVGIAMYEEPIRFLVLAGAVAGLAYIMNSMGLI